MSIDNTQKVEIAEEWRGLGEQRKEFLLTVDTLQRRLLSISSEPEMSDLIREKKKLQQEILAIKDQIGCSEWEIRNTQFVLDQRETALKHPNIQAQLSILLKERQGRLDVLLRLDNVPEVILECAKRIVFELEAPLEELKQHCTERKASFEQELEEARCNLGATMLELERVKRRYSAIQSDLQTAIHVADQNARACRIQQVELGARDHISLEWVLQNDPTFTQDVVRVYRQRFPHDDLSDLFPSKPSVVTVYSGVQKRPKQSYRQSAVVAPIAQPALPGWRFSVTFSGKEDGQELPDGKKQFLSQLKSILKGRPDLSELSTEKIYHKLKMITGMTVVERQRLKQIVGEDDGLRDLAGWKTVKAEGRFRLFLLIDEEKRNIRFLPKRRRDAYLGH